MEAIDLTKQNTRMTLVLALSYSGRWDITQAVQRLATEVGRGSRKPEEIDESVISEYLSTAGMPDPELLIRTSGEQRISNFLLWQAAYSEFFFSDRLWPDFDESALDEAIAAFGGRERRFGKTSAQVAQGTSAGQPETLTSNRRDSELASSSVSSPA